MQFTELENLVRHMVLKRQAIDAVKHNAERFRTMIEHSLEVITIVNHDSSLRYASPSVKKVLGYPSEFLVGKRFEDLVLPEDGAIFRSILKEGTTGTSAQAEFRVKKADSTVAYFEGSFSKMQDAEDSPFLVFNGREITRRRLAEERMRDSDERYKALFECIPAGAALMKDSLLDCNARAAELLGRKREEMIGRNLWILAPERQRDGVRSEEVLKSLVAQAKAGKAVSQEVQLLHKEGRPVDANLSIRSFQYRGSKPCSLPSAKSTRGGRAPPRRPCRRRPGRPSSPLPPMPSSSWTRGCASPLPAPQASRVLSGREEEPLLGQELARFIDPRDKPRIEEDLARASGGLVKQNDRYEVHHADGGISFVELLTSRVLGPDERTYSLVCILRDVTGNVRADELALNANQRMVQMQSLLQEEVEKRLSTLAGDLQLMSFRSTEENVKQHVDKALEQVGQIVKFMDFSKSYQKVGAERSSWFDLGDVIQAAAAHIDRGWANFDIEVEDSEVLADPQFGNALEHLFQGQIKRSIRTKHIRVRSNRVAQGLWLVVEDDGVGYAAEDKTRLFNADYKDLSGHSLHFVKEVLESSGMGIEEMGDPLKGARFVINVPESRLRRQA